MLPSRQDSPCRSKRSLKYDIGPLNSSIIKTSYKRSFSLTLLKCLRFLETKYALREIHERICGSHLEGRTLSYKICDKDMLAHHAAKCHGYGQKVQPVPAILECATTIGHTPDSNHHAVALLSIEDRHTWSFSSSLRTESSCLWLLDNTK